MNEEERELYEGHLKWLRIEASTLEKAEKKAEAKGKLEGKVEMARNLLRSGVAITIIAEASGLSEKDVSSLQT